MYKAASKFNNNKHNWHNGAGFHRPKSHTTPGNLIHCNNCFGHNIVRKKGNKIHRRKIECRDCGSFIRWCW